MSDPERLTKRPPSTTTGALMRAGLAERPTEVSVRRTMKVVATFAGLASTPGGAATAAEVARCAALGGSGISSAPAAALATPALLAKWLAGGAAGGLLISFGLHQAFAPAPPRVTNTPVAQVSAQRARVPARAQVPSPDLDARAPESEALGAPQAEPLRRAEKAASAHAVAGGTQATTLEAHGATTAALAAEVALVDGARARLNANDAHAALAELRGYEARFPERQLYTEVLALRMEASHAVGNEAEARTLAARLLERGVARPLAARARALLAE